MAGTWDWARGVRRHLVGAAIASAAAMTVIFAMPALAQARPGDLDKSFGNRGKTMPFLRGDAESTDIGRKGRIVVSTSYGSNFYVARLRHAGSLDSSFGN